MNIGNVFRKTKVYIRTSICYCVFTAKQKAKLLINKGKVMQKNKKSNKSIAEALSEKCASSAHGLIHKIAKYGKACLQEPMSKDFYEKELFPEKIKVITELLSILTFIESVSAITDRVSTQEEADEAIAKIDISSLDNKELVLYIPEIILVECETVEEIKNILCSIAEEVYRNTSEKRQSVKEFISRTVH